MRNLLLCLMLLPSLSLAQDALHRELGRVVHANNIPAAAVALVQAGQAPRFILFGVEKTTPFRWGSITKTFTAVTLMKAALTANVPLSTRLSDVVTPVVWRNPHAKHPIRLEHLLELTAGMGDLTGRAFSDNTAYTLEEAVASHPDVFDVYWPPGLAHSYSNATLGLSELAIEALTATTFEEALKTAVLEPIGMDRSGVAPDPRLPGGFKADGRQEIPYWNMTFRAFGALNAPIEDLARFLHCLLGEGYCGGREVWPGQVHARLQRPHTGLAAGRGLEVGYAAGIYSRVRNGWVWHGHGGDADGYRSRYGTLPELGLGYAVVINTDNPAALRRMERVIERSLVGERQSPGIPEGRPQNLAAYEGRYYPLVSRFAVNRLKSGQLPSVEVFVQNGRLVFSRGSKQIPLVSLGDGFFRREGDPVATVAFVTSQDNLFVSGELGRYKRVARD